MTESPFSPLDRAAPLSLQSQSEKDRRLRRIGKDGVAWFVETVGSSALALGIVTFFWGLFAGGTDADEGLKAGIYFAAGLVFVSLGRIVRYTKVSAMYAAAKYESEHPQPPA